MFNKEFSTVQKISIAALCMAGYVVVMLYTQSFAFGQYQIRIATAIYGLSALFPFLVIPLGLANFISNMLMGGLGPLDMIGGALVGFSTCAAIAWTQARKWPVWTIAIFITLIPGLVVPIWLSMLIAVPYMVLMPLLVVGQIVPGIVGAVLVSALSKVGQTGVVADR